jgi:hypothetical protein
MESANILQAVEQYREQLKTITADPGTRYFPTHDDDTTARLREFHATAAEWWRTRTDGHS